ncbi:MAG TPA: FAD:protein FMN transferase [Salinimicrobium sp.]|nr:FAD:protein FMN transferase [Salinimicrobium sp.]
MKNLIYLIFIFFISCGESGPEEKSVSGEALGTTFHIKFYSEKDISVQKALDSIFEMVNNSMSTYQPDSDISKLNSGDSLVVVDSLFREVFWLSQKVFKESDGYFDPTVGDLVNMYGFGPEKGIKTIDSSTIDSLMPFVGLQKVKISSEGKVIKESPEIYLDFNAIAKGYTIDLIGNYFDSQNVEHYLIELGGELLAKGKNLSKESFWTVGIDDPNQPEGERALMVALELKNRAMATSGNYRKYRKDSISGRIYVHTINPKTGYPEKSNLLSASVLAPNCALADAYATAFMAMGLEKAKKLLPELQNVDAYLIFSEGNEIKTFASPGFQDVLVELE